MKWAKGIARNSQAVPKVVITSGVESEGEAVIRGLLTPIGRGVAIVGKARAVAYLNRRRHGG